MDELPEDTRSADTEENVEFQWEVPHQNQNMPMPEYDDELDDDDEEDDHPNTFWVG